MKTHLEGTFYLKPNISQSEIVWQRKDYFYP